MEKQHNPYASALDGLNLRDPVGAFFDFCRERENIRFLKESGAQFPWSNDPIFQKGRFLNVFREYDRGSKSILNFASNIKDDIPGLVHALFFARWCNKQETLDQLSTDMLSKPIQLLNKLRSLESWSNLKAYPVEQINWYNKQYSRIEAATELFIIIRDELADTIIDAECDVIKATNNVNYLFNMSNNFPIFMAVMDLAWFRPDIISPDSHVPTGIGAVAYLDRLQKYLSLNNHQQTCEKMIELQKDYWPEAKRPFKPIDIEYLACECRKYYSYVNGTKLFEGDNVYIPSPSPIENTV